MSDHLTAQFTSLLEKSNLLNVDQLEVAKAELATVDASQLRQVVAEFVQRGWLTRWQGRMLLSGRHAFYLGRYKLLDHLGEGGMGSVLKAEQMPIGRVVAIKTLRKEVLSNVELVARFHREIQAAAALSHPNIVSAFDADSVAGQHFLVLEFVEGHDLSELLKKGEKLPVGEACEYIRQAAVGLQHAHERNMVHRDIKPSNLLLTSDNKGRPLIKVLDMGLVRLESDSDEELTQTGQIMGTPDYISPEQGQDSKSADARSDIYSLGCTLFRLLTGRVPFLRGGAIEKITARLTEEPPTLRSVLSDAPEELEFVLQKMLAREPNERYQTASEVILALTPFAISPKPGAGLSAVSLSTVPSSKEVIPGPVEPAMREFLQHLATESADVEGGPEIKESLAETVEGVLHGAEVTRSPSITPSSDPANVAASRPNLIADIAERNRTDRRRLRNMICLIAAFAFAASGYVAWDKSGKTRITVDWPLEERVGATLEVDGRPKQLSKQARIVFIGDAGRRTLRLSRDGYEAIEESWELARGDEVEFNPQWQPKPKTVQDLRWKDLQDVVAAIETIPTDFAEATELKHRIEDNLSGNDVTAERIRETAALIARLPAPIDKLQRGDIDPYELRIAGRGYPKQAPAELVAVFGDSRFHHAAALVDMYFTADGHSIVSAAQDGTIVVWDVETGEARHFIENRHYQFLGIAVDPQGHWVASPLKDGSVQLTSLMTGQKNRSLWGHQEAIWGAAFSPDGRLLASASKDRTVKLWDPESGNLIRTLTGHTAEVRYVAFSLDGKVLASASMDRTVRLWNVADGTIRQTIQQSEENSAYDIAFSPSGDRLAIVLGGKGIDILDITVNPGQLVSEVPGNYGAICYTADGRRFAAVSTQVIDVYDAAENTKVHSLTLREFQSNAIRASFSSDGSLLAIGCEDGMIRLWDTKTWRQVNQSQRATAADIDVDGRRMAVTAANNSVRIIELPTRQELQQLPAQSLPLSFVRFVPQGDKLVTFDGEMIACWDLESRQLVRSFAFRQPFYKPPIDVSPDGRLLAAGSTGTLDQPIPILIWNLETGERLYELEGHKDFVYRVAFDWTGKRLYSIDRSGQSILSWDLEKGTQIDSLDLGSGGYASFEFVPDRTAITAIRRGDVLPIALPSRAQGRVWRHRASGKYLSSTGEHVSCGAISPDCQTIVIAGGVGQIDLYSLQSGTYSRSIELANWQGMTKSVRYTPDGRHLLVTNFNGTVYVLRLKEWPGKSTSSAR